MSDIPRVVFPDYKRKLPVAMTQKGKGHPPALAVFSHSRVTRRGLPNPKGGTAHAIGLRDHDRHRTPGRAVQGGDHAIVVRSTRCWREMDSNFRSPVRRTAFSRLPVRITRPSCYADERSAEHRTPAGAGELGGRAKEPVSVKGELRGIERGPQKVVSLWVRIHGAALLKPEFTPDAEGARPQRSAQDASLWSSKPLFRSHRNG
jgi:hypothetical protein